MFSSYTGAKNSRGTQSRLEQDHWSFDVIDAQRHGCKTYNMHELENGKPRHDSQNIQKGDAVRTGTASWSIAPTNSAFCMFDSFLKDTPSNFFQKKPGPPFSNSTGFIQCKSPTWRWKTPWSPLRYAFKLYKYWGLDPESESPATGNQSMTLHAPRRGKERRKTTFYVFACTIDCNGGYILWVVK